MFLRGSISASRAIRYSILLPLPVPRHEGVLEDVIRHAPALVNPLGLVKRPVDAQLDTALPVLFLSLGERREAAGQQRAYVPAVVLRLPVELVRHESEGNVVGPVEVAQHLKQRPPKP